MNKFLVGILITGLCITIAHAQQSVNPLSKITITSTRATCQKDKVNPQFFNFNYHGNVVVTFADQSTMTADQLEIIFEGKDLGKKFLAHDNNKSAQPSTTQSQQKPLDQFKKVTASGHVTLTSQNRKAQAQKAEIILAQKLCTLTGNVTIRQKKTKPKEFPLTIESDQATLNLQTDELLFTGSESKPVNTVISLEDYEPLNKNTKKSKRKRK